MATNSYRKIDLRSATKEERINFLQLKTGKKLTIGNGILNEQNTRGNIENLAGTLSVPIGIAGPVKIKGKKEHYLSLATTEGALVASVSRGCKAINLSGGASVRILKKGQTRAPLFEVENEKACADFIKFLEKNKAKIILEGQKNSRFLKINSFETIIHHGLIWLIITADTGDALGMNMISLASENIGKYIQSSVKGVKYVCVSGNMCVDKKPSKRTLKYGRGRSLFATVTLPAAIVKDVLKSTPKEMEKLNLYKNYIGSSLSESLGFNAQFANVIAALYLSTGQDLGHVVEGSHGYTIMKATKTGLEASVIIPAVQVATVGGGTKLPAQQECLNIMGAKNADQLSEIVACAVLAGEISLIAAHQTNTLVSAHLRLNR